MPNNWKTYKLSDAFEIIGGGTPKTNVEEYWNGDIPWLSVVDFNNDQRTVMNTEKTITELGLQKSSTKLLKKGQLIISARGTVGQLAQLGRDMTFNQSCYGLNGKNEVLINDFGYYLLKHSVSNIQSNSHGSVFDTITRNTFENIEVRLPEIPEQTAIASILSALDDKIELNLQMNHTLEEMAMTLYKHWFVDFGPFKNGEFIDSELGRIPKGWEVVKLSKLADVIMGTSPKGDTYNDYGEGIPLINGPAQYDTFFPIESKWTTKPTKLSKRFDLIFCVRGSTTGRRVFSDGEYCLGRGVCSIRAKKDLQGYVNIIIDSDLQRLLTNATGSVFPNLTGPMIKDFPVLSAKENIMSDFSNKVEAWNKQIWSNVEENQTLTTLRNTLLPKLISGEVRVKEAEKTLTEAL